MSRPVVTYDGDIDAFWAWFQSVASEFGDRFDNEGLLRELDERIDSLGGFAWELGPGERAANALSLSPAGDRRLLVQTRAIVERAPYVPGWEFHPAKRPKAWEQLVFEMEDDAGDLVEIDASGWRYALLPLPEGGVRVVVEAPNLGDLPEGRQRWAAEILLDGLLGEERRIETVRGVDVVSELARDDAARARPVREVGNDLPAKR